MRRISWAALLGCASIGFANAVEFEDKVLVIVNEDVITQSEFEARKRTVLADQNITVAQLPTGFDEDLLDGMISDRLQLQEAERRELTPTDDEIELAVERYAAQQNLSVEGLISTLAQQGQRFQDFKDTISETISLSRLREFYSQARVRVPDYEIDGFLAANADEMSESEYLVGHLLIRNPSQNRALAERVREEIVTTGNFESSVAQYSEAADKENGGVMGWRTSAQLPDLFVEALDDTSVGGVTPVLESANGLHILKLLDLKGQRTEVIQHFTRHILIEASTEVARAQAAKQLRRLKARVQAGTPFDELARIYSDDSVAAADGGSLDWVTPGDMVRQFEDVMVVTPIGEVSEPFATRFGMHILLVEERRQKNITEEMMRLRADSILRRQRTEREFNQWVRELRESAYVERVSSPA